MSHKDWFDDEGPDLQGTSWQEISPPTVVDSRKRFGIKESSKTDFSLTSIACNAHGRKLKLQQGDGRQAGAVGSKAYMIGQKIVPGATIMSHGTKPTGSQNGSSSVSYNGVKHDSERNVEDSAHLRNAAARLSTYGENHSSHHQPCEAQQDTQGANEKRTTGLRPSDERTTAAHGIDRKYGKDTARAPQRRSPRYSLNTTSIAREGMKVPGNLGLASESGFQDHPPGKRITRQTTTAASKTPTVIDLVDSDDDEDAGGGQVLGVTPVSAAVGASACKISILSDAERREQCLRVIFSPTKASVGSSVGTAAAASVCAAGEVDPVTAFLKSENFELDKLSGSYTTRVFSCDPNLQQHHQPANRSIVVSQVFLGQYPFGMSENTLKAKAAGNDPIVGPGVHPASDNIFLGVDESANQCLWLCHLCLEGDSDTLSPYEAIPFEHIENIWFGRTPSAGSNSTATHFIAIRPTPNLELQSVVVGGQFLDPTVRADNASSYILAVMDEQGCEKFVSLANICSGLRGVLKPRDIAKQNKLMHNGESNPTFHKFVKAFTEQSSVDMGKIIENAAREKKSHTRSTRRKRRAAALADDPTDGLTFVIYPIEPETLDAVTISNGDMKRLQPEIYLNDNLIDFKIKHILRELEQQPQGGEIGQQRRKRIHAFSCMFYAKLTEVRGGNDGQQHTMVRRWTKNFDIFLKEFVLVPVNQAFHWSLATIVRPGAVESALKRFLVALYLEWDRDGQLSSRNDSHDHLKSFKKGSIPHRVLNERDWHDESEDAPDRACILHMDSLGLHSAGMICRTLRHYVVYEWIAKKQGEVMKEITAAVRADRRHRYRERERRDMSAAEDAEGSDGTFLPTGDGGDDAQSQDGDPSGDASDESKPTPMESSPTALPPAVVTDAAPADVVDEAYSALKKSTAPSADVHTALSPPPPSKVNGETVEWGPAEQVTAATTTTTIEQTIEENVAAGEADTPSNVELDLPSVPPAVLLKFFDKYVPTVQCKAPKQENGYDCGLFVTKFAEMVIEKCPSSTKADIDEKLVTVMPPREFSQADVDSERGSMRSLLQSLRADWLALVGQMNDQKTQQSMTALAGVSHGISAPITAAELGSPGSPDMVIIKSAFTNPAASGRDAQDPAVEADVAVAASADSSTYNADSGGTLGSGADTAADHPPNDEAGAHLSNDRRASSIHRSSGGSSSSRSSSSSSSSSSSREDSKSSSKMAGADRDGDNVGLTSKTLEQSETLQQPRSRKRGRDRQYDQGDGNDDCGGLNRGVAQHPGSEEMVAVLEDPSDVPHQMEELTQEQVMEEEEDDDEVEASNATTSAGKGTVKQRIDNANSNRSGWRRALTYKDSRAVASDTLHTLIGSKEDKYAVEPLKQHVTHPTSSSQSSRSERVRKGIATVFSPPTAAPPSGLQPDDGVASVGEISMTEFRSSDNSAKKAYLGMDKMASKCQSTITSEADYGEIDLSHLHSKTLKKQQHQQQCGGQQRLRNAAADNQDTGCANDSASAVEESDEKEEPGVNRENSHRAGGKKRQKKHAASACAEQRHEQGHYRAGSNQATLSQGSQTSHYSSRSTSEVNGPGESNGTGGDSHDSCGRGRGRRHLNNRKQAQRQQERKQSHSRSSDRDHRGEDEEEDLGITASPTY